MLKKTLIHWLMALIFITGLALAISDGDWFPWANFAGLGILALFAEFSNTKWCRRVFSNPGARDG